MRGLTAGFELLALFSLALAEAASVCRDRSRHHLLVELRDAPKPDIGALLPMLVCDEHHLVLAYLVAEPDPAWDGSYVTW